MSSDDEFGPRLPGAFDFTILFEQSILSLLPTALFILVAPWRISHVLRREQLVKPGYLLWAKMATIAVFGALQVSLIVLWSLGSAHRAKTSIAEAALALVETFAIAAVSYAEHLRSPRPSALLNAYLILTIILDVALTRTFWLRSGIQGIAGVFTASLVIKALLLVLEEIPKTRFLSGKRYSDEKSAGVISKSVFWWLNTLFVAGSKRILGVDDLGDIHEKLDSTDLSDKLETLWNNTTDKTPTTLLVSTFGAYKWQFFAGVPARLVFSGFTFAQPFLISEVILFLATPDSEMSSKISSGLIGATVLIYVGLAISNAWYRHMAFQLTTMARGGLISLIFKKTLRLKTTTIKDNAPVTLMSTDMDVVVGAAETLHDVWAGLIDLPIGIYLLYRQVGIPSLFVLIPTVVTLLLSGVIAPAMEPAMVKWNEAIQKRVGEASNMLGQMKGIKMMGLTNFFHNLVRDLRVKEIETSEPLRWLIVHLNSIATICGGLTPMIVILASVYWSRAGEGLSIAVAFTSISIIALVTQPLVMFLVSMMQIGGVVGSFGRIQAFLLLPEVEDSQMANAVAIEDAPPSKKSDEVGDGVGLATLRPAEPQSAGANKSTVVTIAHGTFKSDDETTLLQNVDFTVRESTLNMIVGRVGCGKSSLIKAIIGEIRPESGSVNVSSRSLAYCDQTAWLRNDTIRANIIGLSELNESWLSMVVKACALDEDLERLPLGDESIVGSGGVTLSGGQKQRVALARAVYAQRDIVILDDVFSGLDTTTARNVFQRLLGPTGLLRLKHTTVILATSNANILPAADYITMLADGKVVRNQVPYDAVEPSEWGTIQDTGSGSDSETDVDGSEQPRQKAAAAEMAAPLVTEEELARQTGDTDCYKIYMRSWGKWSIIGVFAIAIIGAGLDVMPQLWLRFWVERGVASRDAGYTGGYIGFSLAAVISASVNLLFFIIIVVPKSGNNLHEDLLTTVTRAPLYFFTSVDSGNLLNRFSQDMTLVDQNLPSEFSTTLLLALKAIAQTGIIASGATYVGAIIPPSLVVLYIIQRYYLRTSRQMRFLDLEAKTPLYTQFTEILAGLSTVRAFGWSKTYLQDSIKLLDTSQKPFYTMFCIQRWLQVVLDLFVAGMGLVLVTIAVRVTGSSSQAAIGLAMVNLISFNMTLTYLLDQWTRLETSLGAIARLKWFTLNTPNENREPEVVVPGADWPSKGLVEIDNVTAAYSDAMDPVILDATVKIQPGQKVGVCGRSGSGKSSLVLTLLRLLEIQSGTVRVDGIDVATVPRQHIRSHITTIPQDPVNITGTIRDNLDPEGHIQSDDMMIQVLEKTNLWSLVETRGGLDADAADLGFSVGQKQLFCLARALLSRNKLVLLDEATSSVDRATDEEIRRIVKEEMDGCTVIEVAHRLEVVKEFDLVIVMGEGKILEVGNPEELLGRASAFKTLWEHQGL